MKASELIAKLQKEVEENGDLDIMVHSPDDESEWDDITVRSMFPSFISRDNGAKGAIEINVYGAVVKPYIVCVTETWKARFLVMAERERDAIKKVSEEYDSGIIDLGRNCFEGCEITGEGICPESKIKNYERIE